MGAREEHRWERELAPLAAEASLLRHFACEGVGEAVAVGGAGCGLGGGVARSRCMWFALIWWGLVHRRVVVQCVGRARLSNTGCESSIAWSEAAMLSSTCKIFVQTSMYKMIKSDDL